MRRILFLIKGLGRGGAEQILASSSSYLDRSRFEYEVAYLLPRKDALAEELRASGVTVHCLDGERGIGWAGRLRRLVRERRIDLVHAHSPVAAAVARLALAGGSARQVYTEHNVWERYHRATYWANLLTFARSDHVFAVSDHVRESIRHPGPLRGLLRMPPVETLYHGIDPGSVFEWLRKDGVREELGIPADAPVVGTVANFKEHKRLDVLLRAAARVRQQIPDVRFVLVGQGPLERPLRRLTRQLGLGATVIFTGYREDAPRVATSFDVFAMSSEYEGLSIAAIEALALGKPAVVTGVGGLAEVVEDGRQGFVVPPGDPQTMADRLLRLLADPDLRHRMGAAGSGRASRFDIRRSVARMEQVYEELLS